MSYNKYIKVIENYQDKRLYKIRNSEGKWVDTKAFRQAALTFMEHGYYTDEAPGTEAYKNFWERERQRCIRGYVVDGIRIPGDHYFYLNYCRINKSKKLSGGVGKKSADFPDFWDGDYEYFWIRDIARYGVLNTCHYLRKEEKEEIYNMDPKEREKILLDIYDKLGLRFKIVPSIEKEGIRVENLLGGKDLIILKARRKGFSFKNASIGANNFFHRPGSYTLQMAYDKKYLYPKGIFSMTMSYINFINEHTAWTAPSDYVRKADHIKNSYSTTINGREIEKGSMSEIQAISFKDNPQAGVGKDCYDIIGEEVGSWGTPGGLKETVDAMLPSVIDGDIRTGMMTLFGTANDISKGTVDFAEMFENIEATTFLPFFDIWGNNPMKKEGFFFPTQLNLVGHYDSNGNSNIESAMNAENLERRKLEIGGATSSKISRRKREFPTCSAEALATVSFNNFPVEELSRRLEVVKSLGLHKTKGTPVELYYEKGQITAKPILDNSVEPIYSYRSLPLDLRGCPIIYEMPVADTPKGLYKIGYDPVDQESGTSLAGIIVYKSVYRGGHSHNVIVAEYVGRYEDPDDIDKLAKMFAELYNTKIMHENMVTGVKNYFRRIKRLDLLAHQPDRVISKNVKSSKVSRVYGCHMNGPLKDAGERYVKTWLTTVLDYDEHGNPITTIDKICSVRLLEELIAYNRKGNFDLVSALFMCMFQVQEEELGKEYSAEATHSDQLFSELLDMMSEMYRN